MVNSIPPKMKYPILSSFKKNPDSQKFLQALTYKTALVISMLEYILGETVFRKGINYFASEKSNYIYLFFDCLLSNSLSLSEEGGDQN